MRKVWLLQRAKVKVDQNMSSNEVAKIKTGDYVRLDYMGSAEFEFGAIPEFQKKIHTVLPKLQNYSVTHKNQTFSFMCLPEEKDEYSDQIIELINDTLFMKERSGFNQREPLEGKNKRNKKTYIYDSPNAPFSFNVWFDLTNNRVIARSEEILNNLRKTISNSVDFMNSQKKVS